MSSSSLLSSESMETNCYSDFIPVAKNGTNARILKPDSYVGFDSLPEQYVSRIVRDGFGFNIMTLGQTGVGKTTLIDSLFDIKFPDVSTRSHSLSNVDVLSHNYELQERNITLKLGLIESRGFGDQINKGESHKSIVEYIEQQNEKYLQKELSIHRSLNNFNDTRIHVCLYLISPVGHGLRAIDLVTMKALDSKCNLIPIIAKSDTFNKQELNKLKVNIMSEIKSNDINIYHFPTDDDSDIAELNSTNNDLLPFATVASHDFTIDDNKKMRVRQYSWGTVQVENENHCDLFRLREMILRVNMEDLRETTHSRHYELYRRIRLEQMGLDLGNETPKTSHEQQYEAIREKQLLEMQRKEDEIRKRFLLKVKEKDAELKKAESEQYLNFSYLKRETTEEKKRLEIENEKLDEEMNAFKAKKASFWNKSSDSHRKE